MVKGRLGLAVFTVLFLGVFGKNVYGEESVSIQQVQVNLPEWEVYFQAPEGWDYEDGALSIVLGTGTYLPERVIRAREVLEPVHYYFLVDCSTSTRENQMAAVRQTLTSFVPKLREEDTFTLITFGLSVDVVLDRQRDKEQMTQAVGALRADQRGTLFFDAIAKAAQLADQKELAGERKLAFVFSDSIDVNLGGYTAQEIGSLLTGNTLPFYGLGFDTGTKEGLDGLGAVARQSGGQIEIVSAEHLSDAFNRMDQLAGEMWVASFRTGSNRMDSREENLTLELKSQGKLLTAAGRATCKYWQPDLKPPKVVDIRQKGDRGMEITFDEAVLEAGQIANYKVEDPEGNEVPVLSAAYDKDGFRVWVTLARELESGTYGVTLKGITDGSMEENPVEGSLELLAEGTKAEEGARAEGEKTAEGKSAEEKSALKEGSSSPAAWYVLTVFTSAVIGAVIFSKKKKMDRAKEPLPETEEEGPVAEIYSMPKGPGSQVRFTAVPAVEITLRVVFQNGESRMVSLPVRNTLFVGRSEICDLCIDDRDLSRQHFVIEEKEGIFSISNLSETNGTRVNGIPLGKPRILQNGDLIEAGQECFTFYEGGQGYEL